jgi:hypothetical protein
MKIYTIKDSAGVEEYVASKAKKDKEHIIKFNNRKTNWHTTKAFIEKICQKDNVNKQPVYSLIKYPWDRNEHFLSLLLRDGEFEIKISNGKIHSEDDTPAVTGKAGKKSYQLYANNGNVTRDTGPAYIVSQGEVILREWAKNGHYHREDGPAVESVTGREWYENGFRHNLKGPAVAFTGLVKFYINNKEISYKEKRIAFLLYIDNKHEELHSYLSCISLKYGL